MILYSNWRSLATYRVRVALALKGLQPEVVPVNLQANEQRGVAFRAINPQGVLPALDDGQGFALFQSLAIIEYLEEAYPEPTLLPQGLGARARVRGIAQIVCSDAHPLIVPRVREYLQQNAGLDEEAVLAWVHRSLRTGLHAVEAQLAGSPHTGRFCHGDQPTVADICLASHLLAMQFFKCDATDFPQALRIFAACEALDAFAASHPLRQPGAPETM